MSTQSGKNPQLPAVTHTNLYFLSNQKVSAVKADFQIYMLPITGDQKPAELLTLRGIPNSRTEDNVTFAKRV